MPKLSPIGWALRPLRRYAEFSGRSPRAEFWWFSPFLVPVFLATWLGIIIAIGSTVTVGGPNSPSSSEASNDPQLALGAGVILLGLLWLALIVPTIALQTRRLHDIDRSGCWIGGFYLLYALYIVFLVAKVGAALTGLSTEWPPNDLIMGGAVGLWLALMVHSTALLIFLCRRLTGTTASAMIPTE